MALKRDASVVLVAPPPDGAVPWTQREWVIPRPRQKSMKIYETLRFLTSVSYQHQSFQPVEVQTRP